MEAADASANVGMEAADASADVGTYLPDHKEVINCSYFYNDSLD
jgi:hypothetical protein